ADQTRGSCSEASAEHAIETGGRTSALQVAENDNARFLSRELADGGCYAFTDPAKTSLAAGLFRFGVGGRTTCGECAFGNNDDTETFTQTLTMHHTVRNFGDVVRNFWYENDVGATRDSGMDSDPSGVPAHHLNHNHSAMTLCRRVQPIERVAGRVYGCIEAKGRGRPINVVIDGLWHTHKRNAF